ncbi:MAG: AzlC family ABC transporter permease [Thermodesulfobacteriota bacterium]
MPVILREGLSAAWPICLGYVPIGLAFGVLAQKAGLAPAEIALMSLFVFAGSSQFIAVSMLSAGAADLAVIATTFMVNIRHLLMSSALSVFLKNTDRFKLSLLAYGVTDESFAVNLGRFHRRQWDIQRALVVNQSANAVWILSTTAGGYGSRFIPEGACGLDYALTAMFICLLVFQLRGRIYVLTALIAAVTAVAVSLMVPGNGYILIAAVTAASLGVVLKTRLPALRKRGEKAAGQGGG